MRHEIKVLKNREILTHMQESPKNVAPLFEDYQLFFFVVWGGEESSHLQP